MRHLVIILALIIYFTITSCISKKNQPFGAENIDYDKIEEINKEGPVLNSEHPENVPPMADKVIVEKGPWVTTKDANEVAPTANFDEFADDGGVPIFEPEHRD